MEDGVGGVGGWGLVGVVVEWVGVGVRVLDGGWVFLELVWSGRSWGGGVCGLVCGWVCCLCWLCFCVGF